MPVNVKSEDDGGNDWEEDPPTMSTSATAAAAAGSAQPMSDDDNDNDDIEDDDDPIVREVDVYLSPALADQIYLLQYPLQQNPQLLLNRLPTAARIKPRHAQMELEYPIIPPTLATNSTLAGAGPGLVGAGAGSAYRQGAFPNMTRRVFQSQTIPVETHMCLGQLKVDEQDSTKSALHLVPLQHISQMRPSFHHVEESAADGDNADGGGGQGNNNNKDDIDHHHDDDLHHEAAAAAAAEKKPIVFQRKESERAAMIRKSSYAYKKASHDAEEWQVLMVCDSHSPEFASNLNQIVVVTKNHHPAVLAPMQQKLQGDEDDENDVDNIIIPDSTLAGMHYIQSLNYVKVSAQEQEDMMSATSGAAANAAGAASYSGSHSSNHDIKSIIARMTVLLGNGGPIPYSILRDQFVPSSSTTTNTSAVSDDKLFQALSICAVLVRGNFCLHSKFLRLSKSMQRARTFLLLLFHKYQTVQKRRLSKLDWQLLLDEETNTSTNSAQQQQQQFVTMDKFHVLLQQVGKRTNAMVNAVDNHAATTPTAGWVLRVEDNLTFVAAHPQEAAQHLTYWNRLSTSSPRIKQLVEQYNNANYGDDDDTMKS